MFLYCRTTTAIFKRDNPRSSGREIDLEICDALIESNQFEQAMSFACSNMKDLTYSHALAMEKRIFLVGRRGWVSACHGNTPLPSLLSG